MIERQIFIPHFLSATGPVHLEDKEISKVLMCPPYDERRISPRETKCHWTESKCSNHVVSSVALIPYTAGVLFLGRHQVFAGEYPKSTSINQVLDCYLTKMKDM